MTARLTRAALTGVTAAALLAVAPHASAAEGPSSTGATNSSASRSAALRAASRPGTLDTVARFFAAEGARARNGSSASTAGSLAAAAAAADPRIEGNSVPVYTLSPEFVRGRTGAPVARLEYLASTAVSADGRKASLWAVPQGTSWRVINIAGGDDESRYAAQGARKLPGGLVFHEPQINGWYVQKDNRILPLDPDAVRAVGAAGTTVAAYRARVHKAYGDKLPGSAYARQGKAGGFRTGTAATAAASDPAGSTPETGAAAAGVLGLGTVSVLLWRRRRPNVRVR